MAVSTVRLYDFAHCSLSCLVLAQLYKHLNVLKVASTVAI